ncbi:MAG TPA: acetylglutamate kinase [Actinomycetota bacterium]|nr:acetylglutamate kinase [Actinomycetota bacterium]
MIGAAEKARVLVESLPYIRRWSGKTVVTKVGGEVVDDESMLASFAEDIVLMKLVGMSPIVVHGGGRQISAAMEGLGIKPRFVGGLRVTDEETMDIVKGVLLDQINKRIVAAMNLHGSHAAGISGEDGQLLRAKQQLGPAGEDLGFVGEIDRVSPEIVTSLQASEFIPIIAPVASGPGGAYNINADVAAGAIAASVGAAKIVFLTNVPGLYSDLGDEGSLISETKVEDLERLIESGRLSEGMIPKIVSAVDALKEGVPQAHILDGRIPHALLLEIFTDRGIGTMVTA